MIKGPRSNKKQLQFRFSFNWKDWNIHHEVSEFESFHLRILCHLSTSIDIILKVFKTLS